MLTGRSMQLQDASVGGPKEGCRALFIHKRCRGSIEMGITLQKALRNLSTQLPIKTEERATIVAARNTKKLNATC